jgi:hypothetical protein
MRWTEAMLLGLALVLGGTILALVLALIAVPTWAFWILLVLVAWFFGPAFARWFLH